VIDYIFVRGVPASDFEQMTLSVFGHRALRVKLDWPVEPGAVLQDCTSFRKHFRAPPPDLFFSELMSLHTLHSHVDFLRFGITRAFSLFILTLGQLFQVSRGPGELLSEPWHRYLSKAELELLTRLESEVFGLMAGAQLGEVPLGLAAKNTELKRLHQTLHSLATRRLFAGVRATYSDPTRLWSFVRKFRVHQSHGRFLLTPWLGISWPFSTE
jgi:hypothetical protein